VGYRIRELAHKEGFKEYQLNLIAERDAREAQE
jgi:hypothetical protein